MEHKIVVVRVLMSRGSDSVLLVTFCGGRGAAHRRVVVTTTHHKGVQFIQYKYDGYLINRCDLHDFIQ